MNYMTLFKNALYVGGGIFLGGMLNSRLIQPQLNNMEIDPQIKAFLGPAAIVGGAFLAQDILPQKVIYGAIGMAGYSTITKMMGSVSSGGSEQTQTTGQYT